MRKYCNLKIVLVFEGKYASWLFGRMMFRCLIINKFTQFKFYVNKYKKQQEYFFS